MQFFYLLTLITLYINLYSSAITIINKENTKDIIIVSIDSFDIFKNSNNIGILITSICNNIDPKIVTITKGLLKREVVNILFFSLLQFNT